jgi:hypothetical protein
MRAATLRLEGSTELGVGRCTRDARSYALGIFDDDSDGLSSLHEVGIWDAGGALLASTTVGPGSTLLDPSARGVGRYVFGSIGLLTLGSGS